MVLRLRPTVVLAALAAVLVATAGPCGAQAQDGGPPSECVPPCKVGEDGRQGIPCAGWCEWYVDCKDGAATPIKCGTSWYMQTYFDNTKRKCRLSIWPFSVDCDWWIPVTTAAPPPQTTTSSTRSSTDPSTAPTTIPSTAPTTNPSIETTSPATPSPSPIVTTTVPQTTVPQTTLPSESTTDIPSESTTTHIPSESTTTQIPSESTTPDSTTTTTTTDKPVPTPSSAERTSAALSTFLLAVGLVVL